MSNARTGLWSALGMLGGIAVGAVAGKAIAQSRPRYQYDPDGPIGGEVEDAMVIGGAVGGSIGAFMGGMLSGEPTPAPQQPPPQLPPQQR
jgi:hypothetical protein